MSATTKVIVYINDDGFVETQKLDLENKTESFYLSKKEGAIIIEEENLPNIEAYPSEFWKIENNEVVVDEEGLLSKLKEEKIAILKENRELYAVSPIESIAKEIIVNKDKTFTYTDNDVSFLFKTEMTKSAIHAPNTMTTLVALQSFSSSGFSIPYSCDIIKESSSDSEGDKIFKCKKGYIKLNTEVVNRLNGLGYQIGTSSVAKTNNQEELILKTNTIQELEAVNIEFPKITIVEYDDTE